MLTRLSGFLVLLLGIGMSSAHAGFEPKVDQACITDMERNIRAALSKETKRLTHRLDAVSKLKETIRTLEEGEGIFFGLGPKLTSERACEIGNYIFKLKTTVNGIRDTIATFDPTGGMAIARIATYDAAIQEATDILMQGEGSWWNIAASIAWTELKIGDRGVEGYMVDKMKGGYDLVSTLHTNLERNTQFNQEHGELVASTKAMIVDAVAEIEVHQRAIKRLEEKIDAITKQLVDAAGQDYCVQKERKAALKLARETEELIIPTPKVQPDAIVPYVAPRVQQPARAGTLLPRQQQMLDEAYANQRHQRQGTPGQTWQNTPTTPACDPNDCACPAPGKQVLC